MSVRCDAEALEATFDDGRTLRMPLPAFLATATSAPRRNCRVVAFGTAIEWPELDEVMGVNVILGVHEDAVTSLAGARPATSSRRSLS